MTRDGQAGKPVAAGLVAQASGATIYGADGSVVWMGPGEPVAPAVPGDTPWRGWDFPIAWNTYKTTDSGKSQETGGVTMSQLRGLANQPHVRAIIETVKDKQCAIEWGFALKPKPGEKVSETDKRAATDPRIAEVAEFFEQPDGEHDLADWIRLLCEDMLVIDAVSIYRRKTIDGKPFSLEIYDGATIQPMLDDSGRRPQGIDPETGEAEIAYQQFIKGIPFADFGWDEFLYARRNPRPGKVYGFSPVEQLLFYINIAIRKDITRLAHFTDGNIPAGLLPMPPGWSPAQIKEFYNNLNAQLAGNLQNISKLIPIPGGTGTPVFPQLDAMKDPWEDLWLRLCCFVFGVSPSSIVMQQNRATATTAKEQADEEGMKVITDFIRRKLNWIIRNWFGYADIQARPKESRTVDPQEQATIDDLRVKTGIVQVNEIRERDGMEPIDELDGRPGFFSLNGYTPFDAALAQVDAKTELALNPPPPPVMAAPQNNAPPKPPAAKAARIPIPTDTGAVIYADADSSMLTTRGLIPVAELVTGDQLVTLQD